MTASTLAQRVAHEGRQGEVRSLCRTRGVTNREPEVGDSGGPVRLGRLFGNELCHNSWPAQADIDELLRKGSGQFIYASVVVNFISDADQHPARQLEIVLGLRPSGTVPWALCAPCCPNRSARHAESDEKRCVPLPIVVPPLLIHGSSSSSSLSSGVE